MKSVVQQRNTVCPANGI